MGLIETKFRDPEFTTYAQPRARVVFSHYETVWFNTGTLCNIACLNCYMASSPRNDQLVQLSRSEVAHILMEASTLPDRPSLIGFTGGEPFVNPDLLGMLEDSLSLGFTVQVLTNAMRPMQRFKNPLLALGRRFPHRLFLRVSLDHFAPNGHEAVRGPGTWQPAVDGLMWLAQNGFKTSVAARQLSGLNEDAVRRGYSRLFADLGLSLDASDPSQLVLFPEMTEDDDVVEISEGCWNKLKLRPESMMCASSRMVVKRKGDAWPTVVACTLIPYDPTFELGTTLKGARSAVTLNHRHCSRFCVLGKASCRVDSE